MRKYLSVMNGSKAGLRSTTWADFRVHEHEEGPLRMPPERALKASRNGKLKKNTVSSLAGS